MSILDVIKATQISPGPADFEVTWSVFLLQEMLLIKHAKLIKMLPHYPCLLKPCVSIFAVLGNIMR